MVANGYFHLSNRRHSVLIPFFSKSFFFILKDLKIVKLV